MADQHKLCKKSRAGRGNSREPSWGGVDLPLCMPPPLPMGPFPPAHLLPSRSHSLSISSSGVGWEANNQGLQLEATTCMIEPNLTPARTLRVVFSLQGQGILGRTRASVKLPNHWKGPHYPAVTTHMPPIFLVSWYHQAASWLWV